ncbi:hypothetical protein DRJ27_03210 [Candidatus Acetothermia bacterium]|nr:MAG: hypothetical protein DRJ27_03210 [Candidatus Acetothermia bacterium]
MDGRKMEEFKQMKESEKIAKQILEQVFLDAEIRHRDTGQEPLVHDFDIVRGSETIAAVEVTTATIERKKVLQNELHQMDFKVSTKQVRATWIVVVAYTDKSIKRRAGSIVNCLAKFERHGLSGFCEAASFSEDASLQQTFDRARRLGVKWATRLNSGPPEIYFIPDPGEVAVLSVDYLGKTIKQLASQSDNLKKLRTSGCNRRILFVVIEELDYNTWKQVTSWGAKTPPPWLPPEITEVWVAAAYPYFDGKRMVLGNKFVVYRSTEATWKCLGSFDVLR